MFKDDPELKQQQEEVMYVDRDRAAAVSLGSKDLTSLKRRKKEGSKDEEVYDEKALFTFIGQGQHELKYFKI